MAAHRLPGHGCSIRYQYGLFEQKIIEGNQVEIPDNWLKNGFAWEYRKPDKAIDVKFNGNAYMKKMPDGSLKLVYENPMTVMAVPYDVPIVGYHNNTVNTLRLWNAEVNRDFSDYGRLTQEQMRQKNDYRNFVESITRYLYPDDSTYDGRRLRLIQEYFFVSAGVQSIVRHYKKVGMDIHDFAQKIAIHINDTHPALCVAELMRILVDEEGLEWNEAWAITKNTIAYTNHTINRHVQAVAAAHLHDHRRDQPPLAHRRARPLSEQRAESPRALDHPGRHGPHGSPVDRRFA